MMTTDDVIDLLYQPFAVGADVVEVTGYKQEIDSTTWVLFTKNGERYKVQLAQFERHYAPKLQLHDPIGIVNEIYESLGLPTCVEGIPHDLATHTRKVQEECRRVLEGE